MAKITKRMTNKVLDIYNKGANNILLTLTDPDDRDNIIMEIIVKNQLSIQEKGMFVDRVVYSCFGANDEFMPQYLEPVFAITLLQMTTNVPVYEKEVPVSDDSAETVKVLDIGKTFELCKAVNLIKNVKDSTYQALVNELHMMVDDKIEYVKEIKIRNITNPMNMLNPLIGALQTITADDSLKDLLNLVSAENLLEDNVT